MITTHRLISLLASAVPVLALAAGPADTERAVLAAMQSKPIKQQTLTDPNDACPKNKQVFFARSPDMVLEFRCGKINLAWEQFRDAGMERKNQHAAELAKRAAAVLGGQGGREVDQAMAGQVYRGDTLASGRRAHGSCQPPSCLLGYK